MTVDEAIEYVARGWAAGYEYDEGVLEFADINFNRASARCRQILIAMRPPQALLDEAHTLLNRVAEEAALNEPPF